MNCVYFFEFFLREFPPSHVILEVTGPRQLVHTLKACATAPSSDGLRELHD